MSKVTEFCIAECERQNDLTTEAVAGMVEAWYYAMPMNENNINEVVIEIIAHMIKPENNAKGYRNTPVIFSNGESGLSYLIIGRAMENLIDNIRYMTPLNFYKEFELIHPFEDGNGRIGAILYNVLTGTMGDPQIPPNIFD